MNFKSPITLANDRGQASPDNAGTLTRVTGVLSGRSEYSSWPDDFSPLTPVVSFWRKR